MYWLMHPLGWSTESTGRSRMCLLSRLMFTTQFTILTRSGEQPEDFICTALIYTRLHSASHKIQFILIWRDNSKKENQNLKFIEKPTVPTMSSSDDWGEKNCRTRGWRPRGPRGQPMRKGWIRSKFVLLGDVPINCKKCPQSPGHQINRLLDDFNWFVSIQRQRGAGPSSGLCEEDDQSDWTSGCRLKNKRIQG